MKLLNVASSAVQVVGRMLAYQWIEALGFLMRRLQLIAHRWIERHKLPERARKASDLPCIPIREAAFHRPDPMLYAQYDLMQRGYAVTWDNPDIELRRGGLPVPSSSLLDANAEYEIVARIWNNSPDAPVTGLPVIFYYLSFGIGIQGHLIGATSINLGVKGGPGHPAFASVKWTTPATASHYCLLVLLAPVDDLNIRNNLGQENVNVGQPHSPAEFSFVLRNQTQRDHAYRFELDSYRLPDLPPCGQPVPPRAAQAGVANPELAGRKQVPPEHDRRHYPVPPGWDVALDPPNPRLAAGGETTIQVRITPPAGFRGVQPVNVNAFDDTGFAGGVTLRVEAGRTG